MGSRMGSHVRGPRGDRGDRVTQKILMIEDDAPLAAMVSEYLASAGYAVTTCETASLGLERLESPQSSEFDALVLDLMLPDMEGLEVCRRLRTRTDIPILMLTARGDETDRIIGLELGADDYLPKPFNPRELLARLRAILRRRRAAPDGASDVLRFGRLEVDRGARVARIDGSERALTAHQFAILCALAENAGRVMSRDALMQHVRGTDLEAFDRSIDVHISRIRAALEDDPKRPKRVITVRSTGYVFARSQDGEVGEARAEDGPVSSGDDRQSRPRD